MDERVVVAQVVRGRAGWYLVLNVGPFENEDLAVSEVDNWATDVEDSPYGTLH